MLFEYAVRRPAAAGLKVTSAGMASDDWNELE